MQINAISKCEYQGNNQSLLTHTKTENKYESNEWVTFLQANSIGRKIKKGAKGVVIFQGFGKAMVKDEKTDKNVEVSIPFGTARVFNLDQTEEMKAKSK